MANSIYQTVYSREYTAGKDLPTVSTDLDSVRAYQFEVQFFGLPETIAPESSNSLTLAAKQVSPVGISVEDIEVARINDKIYYPGKPNQEELVITFDNLYNKEVSTSLYKWFQSIYDPNTGKMTKFSSPGGGVGTFKANKLDIVLLDNTRTPHSYVSLIGVYPKAWKLAEMNYATNEFSTIEVTFRYDFIDHAKYGS